MEIYIRIHSDDGGAVAWWNHEHGESYLMDGKDLWCTTGSGDGYRRGTAFKTANEARREAREAVRIAGWDGMVDPKATFWRYVNGKLVQIKFTQDGKINK